MLGGSKASALAHAACLPTRDASLPLSMTRERVFFTACHEKVAGTCHAERSEASGLTRRAAWPTSDSSLRSA